MLKNWRKLIMLKFCNFCGRKQDEEGFCTNEKCADYKRKEIIQKEEKELKEKMKSTSKANNDKV